MSSSPCNVAKSISVNHERQEASCCESNRNFGRLEEQVVDASRGQVAQSILKALTDGRKRDVNVQHSVQHKLLLKRSSLVQRARVAYMRGLEDR